MFTGQLDAASFACVLFLLLIFLVLSTQFAPTPGVLVKLPPVEVPDASSAPDWLVVAVDREGRLYFNQQVTTAEKLTADLAEKIRVAGRPVPLVLQADAEVQNAELIRLYALCRRLGINEVKLQTRPGLFDPGNTP
jgi:biopolymer transport protein ExbD